MRVKNRIVEEARFEVGREMGLTKTHNMGPKSVEFDFEVS